MRTTALRIGCRMLIGLAGISLCAGFLSAQNSPDDRQMTDPKSVVSASNAAGPVPIPQLYYTRSTYGAAWSPDGRDVVFTTNLTGRANLWKVSAAGFGSTCQPLFISRRPSSPSFG